MAHVEGALTGEQAQVIPLIFWITCLSSLLDISLCVDMTSSAHGGVLFVYVFYCWRRKWHPTPILLPGKSHGRRSLVGCSPWDRYKSYKTEPLHFHFSLSCFGAGNGNPLQHPCLENPRDGGAWWAAIYGVAQSWTRLKRLSSSCISTDPTLV